MPHIYPEVTLHELRTQAHFHGLAVRHDGGRVVITSADNPGWVLSIADTPRDAVEAMMVCARLAADFTEVWKRARNPEIGGARRSRKPTHWLFNNKHGFRKKLKRASTKERKAAAEREKKSKTTRALIKEVSERRAYGHQDD